MSKEEKKAPVKAITKVPATKAIKPVPVKQVPVKQVPAKQVPAKHVPVKHVPAKSVPAKHVPVLHVLTTFDDLMGDFRRSFIENIGFPWEWISVDSDYPVREPTTDLVDTGSKFIVHAEMPAVPKDKIDVTLTKDGIEISAETDVATEEKEHNYVVRERVYSHVHKQLSFPEEVIPEQAVSTLRDGLLEVTIPKKKPAPAPKKHKVVVK
jgi:HSP20 family protein